jgi:hypothetical protein
MSVFAEERITDTLLIIGKTRLPRTRLLATGRRCGYRDECRRPIRLTPNSQPAGRQASAYVVT